jgi:hypothetical protein
MDLTAVFARKLLADTDPEPGLPSRGELFLSFLVVKNVTDLCETGRAILDEMSETGANLTGLPSKSTMALIRKILKELYDEKMFIPDDQVGFKPNWDVIMYFNKDNTQAAFRLYRIIRRNVKGAKDMPRALQERDKKFFLENIDTIFANIPMKDLINQFKNFIGSPHVPKESQDLVWDFFEQLIDIFLSEKEHLELIFTL